MIFLRAGGITNAAAMAGEAASQAVSLVGKTSTVVRTAGGHLSRIAPTLKKAVATTATGAAQGGAMYGAMSAIEAIVDAVKGNDLTLNGPALVRDDGQTLWDAARNQTAMQQPPVSMTWHGTLEVPTLAEQDKLRGRPMVERPLDGPHGYGTGVEVTGNFQGQIQFLQIGQLYLGLEEAVIFAEIQAETLIDMARNVVQRLGLTARGLASLRSLDNRLQQKRVDQMHVLAQTTSRAALSLVSSIQGIDRRHQRNKRWLDEMSLGLGRFHQWQEAAQEVAMGRSQPELAEVQARLVVNPERWLNLNATTTRIIDSMGHTIASNSPKGVDLDLIVLTTAVEALVREMDLITTSVKTMIATGRLSPDLLPDDQIDHAFDALQGEALSKGLVTLIQEPAQLLRVPIQMGRNPEGIRIWIKVSMVPANEAPFEVLKASPALLRASNGHLFQLNAKSAVIIRGAERFSIEDNELEASCIQQAGYLACTRNLVSRPRASCETELLGGDLGEEASHCQQGLTVLDPYQEHLSQVGTESFDWYGPEATTFIMECPDGRRQEAQLQGLCRVDVERGCKARSKRLVMDGAENAVRTTISGGWAVPPTRVHEVMDRMNLPEPEEWENLSEVIYRLNQVEGGPTVNDLIRSLPTAKLLPRPWADIPEDLQNLWLTMITLFIFTACIVMLCVSYFPILRNWFRDHLPRGQMFRRSRRSRRTISIPEGHEFEAWVVRPTRGAPCEQGPVQSGKASESMEIPEQFS